MNAQSGILVIGAGPAGVATAACLQQRGLQAHVIEQASSLASSWRAHYERLHLHTVKTHSALPGMPFPEHYPRYVSRQQLVEYLDAYAAHFDIAPDLQQRAVAITRSGAGWQVRTESGRCLEASTVVVATGANRVPRLASFTGRDQFEGKVLHSRDYRDATPFKGRRVLVVGMGNTGAEIALDLTEHGAAAVSLAVRSPLNIVYRDVLGRPTQLTSILLGRLPTRWGDALARVLRDLTVGDLRRWGIQTSTLSPLRQLREHGKTPLIDIGTLARIRRGEITVYPGIDRFSAEEVHFSDGRHARFDDVILATGYAPRLEELFPDAPLDLDANGMPHAPIGSGALAGIYFVGFDIRAPGGLLRTIAQQAERVAEEIERSAKKVANKG